MIQLPIIGAFLEASGMILEKKILKLKSLKPTSYTTYEFMAIVIMSLPFIYFFWHLSREALTLTNIFLFAIVVISATLANLLIFYSLKRENVTEFEPIWIMQPLFTIVLAFFVFESERKWSSIILALIASIALILAHIRKHHLKLDKYVIAAVVGSFLFSVELIASKPILQFYNPLTFYFLRCLFILIICYLLYRPSGKELNRKSSFIIILIGLMWVIYRVIIYYGYENIGVIQTTTIFLLSPVLMIFFAIIFLKEKLTWRQIVSTLVIIACVVLSLLIK